MDYKIRNTYEWIKPLSFAIRVEVFMKKAKKIKLTIFPQNAFLLSLLIALMLINISYAGKYRAKGWGYVSFLGDGGAVLPPRLYVKEFAGAIGFAPPIGLGLGTAVREFAGPFKYRYWDDYSGKWYEGTNWFGTYLPIYLYWVPYANWERYGIAWPVVYFFFGFSKWAKETEDYGSDSYLRTGIGLHYSMPGVGLGAEAGIISYKQYYWSSASTSPFLGVTISLGSIWVALGAEEIPPPSIQLIASFDDADGNQILSGNEEGKLQVLIPNKGAGKAKGVSLEISIPEKEYKDRIIYQEFLGVGDIEANGSRSLNIPVKAKGELPKGSFTLKINCTYTAETGEKGYVTQEITINTAPTTGMIKVAFKNLSPEELPSWIIPTPLEYADYSVEYSQGRVTILNLNTGERRSQSAGSATEAQNFAKNFFLSWDKESPKIILSSSGGTVNTEKVKLSIRLSDDRKLEQMKVYLNGSIYKTESFAEATETEREVLIPLKMGDNDIKVTLSDWVGKSDEKTITFTRIRGGSGTYVAGSLPQGEPPPALVIQASPLDGNNTVVGGNEEGIKVVVTNRGRGTARWVRVILEGDEYLVKQWGKERNLEDIKPGETKTATFSLLMPTELQRREADIEVVVKEGRGYSPTEKPSLKFTLIPAEVVTKEEELIEDVDYDIPSGRIKREDGYALIIGLSKYSNVLAPKYSKNDAEAFSKYVSKVFGIANAKTIYDEKATGSTIKANLTDWLKTKKGFKVIYFAGHGVPDPENPREGDVYLLPYDGDPELKSTLISQKEIAELGANSGDTVLVFLDACFSGAEGRTVQLASRPLVVSRIKETNAITFAAAEGNQPSKEFENAKHGYFTYYTLLGLKGKADSDRDGWITTTELYNFVKEKVSDATNNVQIPVLRPEKEIRIGRIK